MSKNPISHLHVGELLFLFHLKCVNRLELEAKEARELKAKEASEVKAKEEREAEVEEEAEKEAKEARELEETAHPVRETPAMHKNSKSIPCIPRNFHNHHNHHNAHGHWSNSHHARNPKTKTQNHH